MRQISLSLISSALILVACSKPPEPKLNEVQKEEVTLEESRTPIVASTAEERITPVVAEKKKKPATYRKAIIAPEEPALIQEEQEVIGVKDYRDSSEINKTYNELQISDDADDFPLYESVNGRPYNETQISQ